MAGILAGLGDVSQVISRLRYPQLFVLLAALLLVDLVVPDPLPYIDEMVLAILTVLVGGWKRRREETPVEVESAKTTISE